MKRGLLLCLLCVALFAFASQVAFAASDISVTVTLQNLGVSVSPVSWGIGTVAAGASKSTWSSSVAGHFTATNTGNVAESFTVSAGSTSPSGWSAGSSSAVNVYVIGFGKGTPAYTVEPSYTTFTGSGSLASSVAASSAVDFDLKFTAPAAGSTISAQETFSVSLSAAAA